METLETLKRQIKSASDMQSVVRTMKTLAAVNIRQYEAAVESLADYYSTVEAGLQMVLWHLPGQIDSLESHAGENVGAVVFGSDQGMCGQFNDQITTHSIDWVSAHRSGQQPCRFLAMGVRTANRLQDAGLPIDHEFLVPSSASGIAPLVQDLLMTVERWQREHHLNRIVLLYNHRTSPSSSEPHVRQLLPVDPEMFTTLRKRRWPSRSLPTFTMDQKRLLSSLVRQYLFVSVFRACAESLAAENASRIASMQAAEHNINERLSQLQLGYNHQRQTSITGELLDVVTGFEAITNDTGV